MPAPKQNSFWKLRTSHGRDKIFESPTVLWEACAEYFEACETMPLREERVFANGKRRNVSLMRAFTLRGMFVFLDIDRKTWELYSNREDFIPIVEQIENIIYTQKFEGAAVGLFKENLIARELGLADKSKLELDDLTDAQIDALFSKHVLNQKP